MMGSRMEPPIPLPEWVLESAVPLTLEPAMHGLGLQVRILSVKKR